MLQNQGIEKLTQLIAELFPVIITVVMIMLVVGIVMNMAGGGNKKRGGILALVLVSAMLFSLIVLPVTADGAYNESVSPGSTSVYDGMPTTETFRGLDPTEEHLIKQLVDEDISHDSLFADSAGILIVSITPYRSGSNPYGLWNSTHQLLTFTIQNNSIMDYLIPIFTIMIMVSILGLIMSIFTRKM